MRNDLARKEAYSLKTCNSYRCETETKTQSMENLKKRSPFLISLAAWKMRERYWSHPYQNIIELNYLKVFCAFHKYNFKPTHSYT